MKAGLIPIMRLKASEEKEAGEKECHSEVTSMISTFHAVHGIHNLGLGELQGPDQLQFTWVKRKTYGSKISVGPSMICDHMTCFVGVLNSGDDIGAVNAVPVVTVGETIVKKVRQG